MNHDSISAAPSSALGLLNFEKNLHNNNDTATNVTLGLLQTIYHSQVFFLIISLVSYINESNGFITCLISSKILHCLLIWLHMPLIGAICLANGFDPANAWFKNDMSFPLKSQKYDLLCGKQIQFFLATALILKPPRFHLRPVAMKHILCLHV